MPDLEAGSASNTITINKSDDNLQAALSEAKERRSFINPLALLAASPGASLLTTAGWPKRIDVVSGLVQATLIFSLCASFSTTLLPQQTMHQPQLMQSFLLSATLSGLVQTLYSDLDLSLAAPDIVPTLLFATVLARGGGTEGITLGTAFAMMAFMTTCAGWGCIFAGRVGVTSKANNRIPEHIFHGFIVVAGLLILSKGVKMAMPHDVYEHGPLSSSSAGVKYVLFALAGLPHGLGMFLQKRYAVIKSEFALPAILLAPLIVFFAGAMLTWGPLHFLSRAREFGWLFEDSSSNDASSSATARFYHPAYWLYFSHEVDFAVLLRNLPLMLAVSAFLVGDVFFKAAGTIKLLNTPTTAASVDQEMILAGKCNIVCGVFGGVPSYVQMKLAALNRSVVGKASTSRMPGLVSTLTLGGLCLSGLPLVLFVPRFFLAGILYNVAFGFVVESFVDVPMTPRQRAVVAIMVVGFLGKNLLFSGLLPDAFQ